jgi:hypothetical protein
MEFENSASAWREDSTASLRRSSLWVVESRISDVVLYWRKLRLLCMVWAFEMVWALSRKRWSELSRAYLRIEGPSKAMQRVSHWGSFREENERVKIGLSKFLLSLSLSLSLYGCVGKGWTAVAQWGSGPLVVWLSKRERERRTWGGFCMEGD